MSNVLMEVYDERPELGAPRLVHTFTNVPKHWTNVEAVSRYGIAEHLTVYRTDGGGTARVIIQHGRRR